MKKILLSLALAAGICLNASSQVDVSPLDANILVEGRTITSGSALKFCYPGTAFTVKFTGTSAAIKLKPNAGYYVYSVDGGSYVKFSTHGASSEGGVFTKEINGLAEGEHTVKVMLVSEGLYVGPEFYGFQLNSGAKLLKIDTKKKLKIEFIGNSITCGYGIEAPSAEDHFADSTSNFSMSYAGQTIKRLGAISMVVVRSGIGIYKNFGDKKDGSDWPMPRVYENTLISDSLTAWDFSKWKPDVVVITLGTNDLSENNYDLEKFAVAHIAFVKSVRKHYPTAKIVLCTSPMLHDQQGLDLITTITNSINAMITQGDSRIYKFDFQELEKPEDYGADWHPSHARATDMARYLTYFIENTVLKKK